MRRRVLLATCTVALLVLPAGLAGAAPDDSPSRTGPHAVPSDPPEGDRDRDRVSDDFESRLRGAAAAERLRVIVTGVNSRQARRTVGSFVLGHELSLIDGFAATMTAAQARALARAPGVRRVEEDGTVHALDDATDRDFGAAAARAGVAGLDGSGVGICVIDTGIDPGHEQIAPRTVAFNDYVNNRTTAYDDHGHGTHVAAIAAGDGVGGSQAATFVGVAPAAGLWGAKVLSSAGSGADSDVAAAVQWCHEQPGVQVLSLSLGSPGTDGTDAVSLAVDRAATGADGRTPDVVVVAAGNSGDAPGTVSAPGVAAEAVTVGAVADHSAPWGTERHDDGVWLAAFSGRGPTLSGMTKPDVAAPGVTVTSAQAGTGEGYVTYSGTSMAAPYVSGAVALGLEAAPGTAAAAVKTALRGTAMDVGAEGVDGEWGAGLVDVRGFVDRLVPSGLGSTPFPTRTRVESVVVPDGGSADIAVRVGSDGLGVPLVVMSTQSYGQWVCDVLCAIGWSAGDWTPDLDVELRDPSGQVVARSECSLGGINCRSGRQETVAVGDPVAGTYTLRVFAWPEGSGAGGTVDIDVFHGPLATPGAAPEPPEPNKVPTANAGPDQDVKIDKKTKVASFTLDGSGSTDSDGTVAGYQWTDGTGAEVAGTATVILTTSVAGTYEYTLVVTDDVGAVSAPDTVVVTVGGSTGGGGGGGGKPPRR